MNLAGGNLVCLISSAPTAIKFSRSTGTVFEKTSHCGTAQVCDSVLR